MEMSKVKSSAGHDAGRRSSDPSLPRIQSTLGHAMDQLTLVATKQASLIKACVALFLLFVVFGAVTTYIGYVQLENSKEVLVADHSLVGTDGKLVSTASAVEDFSLKNLCDAGTDTLGNVLSVEFQVNTTLPDGTHAWGDSVYRVQSVTKIASRNVLLFFSGDHTIEIDCSGNPSVVVHNKNGETSSARVADQPDGTPVQKAQHGYERPFAKVVKVQSQQRQQCAVVVPSKADAAKTITCDNLRQSAKDQGVNPDRLNGDVFVEYQYQGPDDVRVLHDVRVPVQEYCRGD